MRNVSDNIASREGRERARPTIHTGAVAVSSAATEKMKKDCHVPHSKTELNHAKN